MENMNIPISTFIILSENSSQFFQKYHARNTTTSTPNRIFSAFSIFFLSGFSLFSPGQKLSSTRMKHM